ncbi:hypothetical protein KQI65_11920 [bacterium]|nr:hypothetical protein [bacterium]
MLFRFIFIAIISWLVYSLFRRLFGGSQRSSASRGPFQRTARKRRFDGQAVDADFEELDDRNNDE